MLWKNFFRDEDGVVAMEYVLFCAAIAILLVVGVGLLFTAMSDYFGDWADFFSASGGGGQTPGI